MANRRKRPKSPQRLDHVRWEHYSHRHLWNMIMDAHPNDVFGRHHHWVQLGRDLVKIN